MTKYYKLELAESSAAWGELDEECKVLIDSYIDGNAYIVTNECCEDIDADTCMAGNASLFTSLEDPANNYYVNTLIDSNGTHWVDEHDYNWAFKN